MPATLVRPWRRSAAIASGGTARSANTIAA